MHPGLATPGPAKKVIVESGPPARFYPQPQWAVISGIVSVPVL
jgi:hypothetical protein